MADPKLKSVSVTIKYSSDDGYGMEAGFSGGPRNPRNPDPVAALREAHRETARLLALFGFQDMAIEATAEAVNAVSEWRAQSAAAHKGE